MKYFCSEIICVVLVLVVTPVTYSLDNGLARTPPMGWLAWERFRCKIDCDKEPDHCISENLFLKMGELLVKHGFLAAGYDHVNIDDCWSEKNRGPNGELVADRKRFPHGIKWLADKLHGMGIKLGIYGDYGTKTCAGYPGIKGHIEQDANTYAGWGVDMLKLDGCYANATEYPKGYPEVEHYLNATGRPIAFSCSWPAYVGGKPNYTLVGETCNLWRNYGDIQDSWDSVKSIIGWYGTNNELLAAAQGPGKWNDPDMLIIGDFSLSYEESKSQMAMWSIMAAPLLFSNDLRKISRQAKEILLNEEVIQINQDEGGHMGKRIYNQNNLQIWVKQLTSMKRKYLIGAVFLNYNDYGTPQRVVTTPKALGLVAGYGYKLRDLFEHLDITGTYYHDDPITFDVNPNGVVMLGVRVGIGENKLISIF